MQDCLMYYSTLRDQGFIQFNPWNCKLQKTDTFIVNKWVILAVCLNLLALHLPLNELEVSALFHYICSRWDRLYDMLLNQRCEPTGSQQRAIYWIANFKPVQLSTSVKSSSLHSNSRPIVVPSFKTTRESFHGISLRGKPDRLYRDWLNSERQ